MSDNNDLPELQNGWEWSGGERGKNYYTTNFGTEYYMGGRYAGEYGLGGFSGQVFWDKGQKHTVQIMPVLSMNGDDPVFGYAAITRRFDTEEEAHNAVPDLIDEL